MRPVRGGRAALRVAGRVGPATGDAGRLDEALSVWAGVLLFGAGSALGLAALLVAGPGRGSPSGWFTTAVSATAAAVIGLGRRHLPRGWPHAAAVLGTLNIGASVLFDPQARSANEAGALLMLLWVCLFASCFFSARAAAAHLLVVASMLLVLMAVHPPPFGAASAWLMISGSFAVAVVIVRTQQAQLNAALDRERLVARTDVLTGLANRRAVAEWFLAARTDDRRCALVIADLDHFKLVNDECGHDHGDRVLQQVARVLAGSCRAGDVAARLGGEEFMVLLPDTDVTAAGRIAERIRSEVAAAFTSHRPTLTASFGVAAGSAGDLAAVLRAADAALYDAKQHGRNRVVLASPRPSASAPFSAPQARPSG